jgi:hypothetical protein
VAGDFGSGAERGTMVVLGGTGLIGVGVPRSAAGGDEGGNELVWACQGARPACCARLGTAPNRTLNPKSALNPKSTPNPKSTLNIAAIDGQRGRWRSAMAFPLNSPNRAQIPRHRRQLLKQNQGGVALRGSRATHGRPSSSGLDRLTFGSIGRHLEDASFASAQLEGAFDALLPRLGADHIAPGL